MKRGLILIRGKWLQLAKGRPLATYTSLHVVIPVSLLCGFLGLICTYSVPIHASRVEASAQMEGRPMISYAIALRDWQTECLKSPPDNERCDTSTTSTRPSSAGPLLLLTQVAGLENCRAEVVKFASVLNSDPIKCSSRPQPTWVVIVWLALAIVGGVLAKTVTGFMYVNRRFLPRYNPTLWLTPWVLAALVSCVTPLVASIALWSNLVAKFDPSSPSPAYANYLVWPLGLVIAIVAFIVTDLKTFDHERRYLIGLGKIVALLGAAVGDLFLARRLIDEVGLSRWMTLAMAFSLAIVVFLCINDFRRSRQAREDVWAFAQFALKFLALGWVVVILPQIDSLDVTADQWQIAALGGWIVMTRVLEPQL